MDKATKERLNILAGISSIEFFVRSKAMDWVDSISKVHPMLKLYFDSELNSEIENNALLALSEAVIWSVEKFTARGIMSKFRDVGVSIAQTLNKRMYFAKLVHHANTGRITSGQFYELAAEYIAAESVNMINQLWDAIGVELPQYLTVGIQKALEWIDVDPQTAEYIAGWIDGFANMAHSYVKKFLTEEKIQEFVCDALKYTIQSARNLLLLADKAVETTKETIRKIESKIKAWGREICNSFDWNIPEFLKEYKDSASDIGVNNEKEVEEDVEDVEEDVEDVEDVEEGLPKKVQPKDKKRKTKVKSK